MLKFSGWYWGVPVWLVSLERGIRGFKVETEVKIGEEVDAWSEFAVAS